MQILWSFQALIRIGPLKQSASSRTTPLFHAATIKKPRELAAAFP